MLPLYVIILFCQNKMEVKLYETDFICLVKAENKNIRG